MSLALTLQSGRNGRIAVGARDAITGQGVVHAAGRSLVSGAISPKSSRPSSDSNQADLLRSLHPETAVAAPPWAAAPAGLGATYRRGSTVAAPALNSVTTNGGSRGSNSRHQLSRTGHRPQGTQRGDTRPVAPTSALAASCEIETLNGGSVGQRSSHRYTGPVLSTSLAADDRWAVPPWLPANGLSANDSPPSQGRQRGARGGGSRGCGGGPPHRAAPLSIGPPPGGGRAAHNTFVARDANSGFRAYMEDSAVVVDPYAAGERGVEQWGFFAVYDGHGGRQAVDYCEAKLHDVVLDELRSSKPWPGASLSDEAVADALTRSFQRVDDQLRLVGAWRCGCTATVALLRRTPAALRLHLANVGDSRGVIVDASHAECRVSQDHRPTDLSEVRRIEAEGGFVSRGRVAGMLGVSRALGDHALKSSGVAWRPHVCARDATHDAALVIASDGLWDTVSDADARLVVERCMLRKTPEQAAQALVGEAMQRGSMDNITCLVTYFDGAIRAS